MTKNSGPITQPLPDGWALVTVGEIAEHINSGFPCGKHNTEGIGVPHLRPMNISPHGEIDLSLLKYVEASDYDALKKGDVLFNNTNSPDWLGKTTYIDKDTNWAYSNHMTRVRLYPGPNPAWVAYSLYYLFLTGFFRLHCRHHVNQASINTTFLSERVSIPVPPVSEQHRIVAEIETQFTRLEAGVAALKRAQANLRRYKASVLKAACEGRLVPTEAELARAEGRDYEPADVLLQRILAERRAKWVAENLGKKYKEPALPDTSDLHELPEGWRYALLAPLLSVTRPGIRTGPFGSLLKKHEHRTEGVPVLGIENIESMKFAPGNKIFVTEAKAAELSRYDVQPGDVLISRSGTVGEVCVVPPGLGEARMSTNLMRVVLAPNGMLPRFFTFLFNGSPFVLDQVSELCSGSTRDFLNQKILSSIIFPVPPLAEQHRIVAEVERRLSVVGELEKQVEAALRRAERLRQAILKHAFEGKLVPQDPDDEPASELLERIRAGNMRRPASHRSSGRKTRKKGRREKAPEPGDARQLKLL